VTPPWATALLAPRHRWFQVAKSARHLALSAEQDPDRIELTLCDLDRRRVHRLGLPTDGFLDSAWPAADGRAVFRLDDRRGDELGHVVRYDIDIDAATVVVGVPVDLTPDRPDYALRGADVSADGEVLVLDTVTADGYELLIVPARWDGRGPAQARTIVSAAYEAWNCRVSADGTLVSLDTTDHAPKTRRFAASVFTADTGALVARFELPAPGVARAVTWSGVAGDQRLLVATQGRGARRSGATIWSPLADAHVAVPWPDTDLYTDPDATVAPLDWSTDARFVLGVVQRRTRQRLHRRDLSTGRGQDLDLPEGSFVSEYLRTSVFGTGGTVLAGHENGRSPLSLLRWSGTGDAPVLFGAGPAGAGFTEVTFESSDAVSIQGWFAAPSDVPVRGAVVYCHGGPHTAAIDEYSPAARAWTESGFAFLAVNYRGSTGRSRDFEEQLHGDVGHWELEDLAAARAWLVEQGHADADRVVITGESYGGYLVLYALGRQPTLWAAGIAEVALADWALTHRDSSPAMKQLDLLLFGGSPAERPELYRERSATAWAHAVRAPVLLWQGRNDTRTPPAQIEHYAALLTGRGHPVELTWFDGGHGFGGDQEYVEHLERATAFAAAAIAGVTRPVN